MASILFAYVMQLYNIEQQLLSIFGERDVKFDAMLRFTKPVSGSYFYAPSLSRLAHKLLRRLMPFSTLESSNDI